MRPAVKLWYLLLVFGLLLNLVNAGLVGGDTDVYENQYGKLEVWPKTSVGFLQHTQFLNVTPYFSGVDIDVCFRFDYPLDVSKSNVYRWVRVTRNYSYYVDNDVDEPEWDNGTSVGYKWRSVKDQFNYVQYGGKHYYYVTGVSVPESHKTYRFKITYTPPEHYRRENNAGFVSGKWDLLVKRSDRSIQESFIDRTAPHIILDPDWYDINYGYAKRCDISDPFMGVQIPIIVGKSSGGNVTCEGNCNDNFSDVVFTNQDNTTRFAHWIRNYTSGDRAYIFVNNSENVSVMYMYYGYAGASDLSDGYETFVHFDDCEQDGGIGAKWDVTNDTGVWYDYVTTNPYSGSRSVRGYDSTSSAYPKCYQPYNHNLSRNYSAIGWKYNRTGYLNAGDYNNIQPTTPGLAMSSTRFMGDGDIETYVVAYNPLRYTYNLTDWENFEWKYLNDGVGVGDDYSYLFLNDEVYDDIKRNEANNYTTWRWLGSSTLRHDFYWDDFYHRNLSQPMTGWSNFQPEISADNSVPVNSNPIPSDGKVGVRFNPVLVIKVYDEDEENLDVLFRSNQSGSWSDLQTNSSVPNGWYNYSSTFTGYGVTIWWSVNTTDGEDWDNDTYSFTLDLSTLPNITVFFPTNLSTDVCPDPVRIGVTVSDDNGDLMNITFRSNLSGFWDWFYTGFHPYEYSLVNLTNGTYYLSVPFFSAHDQEYYWNVTVSDGSVYNHSGWLMFTTDVDACDSGSTSSGSGGGRDSYWVVGVGVGMAAIALVFMKRRKNYEG